jgi:hypothetical protein
LGFLDPIATCVEAAGGIFGGIWDTPQGRFAMVTEPLSLSSTLTAAEGITVQSVRSALAEVRHRFGHD